MRGMLYIGYSYARARSSRHKPLILFLCFFVLFPCFVQKRYHQQSRQQQQETSDKQNAATSGSKPGVVASEASVVLPKGVPGNNKAAKLFPRDLERDLEQNIEQNLEQNLEQDLEQDFLLSGGVLDSEEDEDGDFDEEYDDTFYGDEGDSQ